MQIFYSVFGRWAYLLALTIFSRHVHGQTCFFENGDPALDDIPCSNLTDLPGAAVPCCGSGRTCLNNRLCSSVEGDPNLSRGSCTDQSWQSVNCPQMCGFAQKGVVVYNCTARGGFNDNGQVQFCCLQNTDCCLQPAALFVAGPWDFDTLSKMPPASSATSSSTTTSSSTATSSPTATNDKVSSSGTDYTGIGIGVGIGVSVPLVSIAAVGLVWCRRRRHGHQSVSSGSSLSTKSNKRTTPPFRERDRGVFADDTDRRAAEARSYELDSIKKPAELHGSEPDTRHLDVYEPTPLRPSSMDKQD